MVDNELDTRQPKIADTAVTRGEPGTAQVARKPNAADRGLDWNLVSLAPGGEAATVAGVGVDVLIHVLFGTGRLTTDAGTVELAPGTLLWLPSLSRPQFTAGPDGLRYLSVNQRWDILPP